jgi:protein-L-isoaspartate(D-aspartate) O-methyltransferase
MNPPPSNPFSFARDAMLTKQLMSRGIHSAAVLHAMAAVPRHAFVAPEFQSQAYDDCALPAASGQTISKPYIVAIMTQLLNVQPQNRILEIGTGTGYQTAILATLASAGHVFTVERIPQLADAARETLACLGIQNVTFLTGDGTMGWPGACFLQDARFPAPPVPTPTFDRILITAGTPEIPPPVLAQLADDGILVAPRGNVESQRLVVITRRGTTLSEHLHLSCRFVPLIGAHGWKADQEPRA